MNVAAEYLSVRLLLSRMTSTLTPRRCASVRALAIAGDVNEYAWTSTFAGQFTKVNGVGRNSIARLNSDGTLDAGFQNGLSGVTWNSGAARVESLAVQSDGKVLIGGDFWTVNGAPATYFARLWGADLPPLVKSVNRSGADVNLSWYAISNRTYLIPHSQNSELSSAHSVLATARIVSMSFFSMCCRPCACSNLRSRRAERRARRRNTCRPR